MAKELDEIDQATCDVVNSSIKKDGVLVDFKISYSDFTLKVWIKSPIIEKCLKLAHDNHCEGTNETFISSRNKSWEGKKGYKVPHIARFSNNWGTPLVDSYDKNVINSCIFNVVGLSDGVEFQQKNLVFNEPKLSLEYLEKSLTNEAKTFYNRFGQKHERVVRIMIEEVISL